MKSKLIKFGGKSTEEFLAQWAGKKVCDVVRYRSVGTNPAICQTPLPYLHWTGSTESEYFRINFFGGLVTLAIEEREMKLDMEHSGKLIALAAPLRGVLALLRNSQTPDIDQGVSIQSEYINQHYEKDLDQLIFRDVMKILDWKFISRKVKEHRWENG